MHPVWIIRYVFTADNGTQSFSWQKIDFEYFAVQVLISPTIYLSQQSFAPTLTKSKYARIVPSWSHNCHFLS